MTKSLATVGISCGLLLAATGCAGGSDAAGPAPVVTKASTVAPASETSTPAPTEPEPSSSAPSVEESLSDFGQTWDYRNGISVTVTHKGTAQASMNADGAQETDGQMHLFKVTITNGTEAIFDPNGVYTTVNYGEEGEVAERVFDASQGYADTWQGKVLPGNKRALGMAFAIPTDKPYEVLLSVAPDFDYKDALFHGVLGK